MIQTETYYRVYFQHGTYKGQWTGWALDNEHAIAKAKDSNRQWLTLPMAYESWRAEPV